MEKVEEMNQELKRHVSALERSNEEHKRLVRKREKELDQVKNDLELNISNSVTLNHKVFLHSCSKDDQCDDHHCLSILVYKTRSRTECSTS